MKALLAVAALALVLVLGAVSQTPTGPKHHVVFQMSEPPGNDWGALVRHVNNMREALAKDGGSQVEVVFFGSGLNMLRKTNTEHTMRPLHARTHHERTRLRHRPPAHPSSAPA